MLKKKNNQGSAAARAGRDGFVLISLILAIAIIAVIFAVYYGGSGGNSQSVKKAGDNAVQQIKINNTSEIENHIQIQNELNSIEQ